ncbi:hypothetical protein BGZ73_003423 [Actinomortierella ambigua]|nr:hypothetical protein BGZ73_003423 [Actinomortierella ambigua]
MSTRRSSRSKPAAATAADPIHIDSGAATPEPSTPPAATTDTTKKDQQLETSTDVSATNEPASADTPATPADTPSESPIEPEAEDQEDTSSSDINESQAQEVAPDTEIVEGEATKNKEEKPVAADDDKPTVVVVETSVETATPTLDDEASSGIKRPEPDSKEEAEKESRDYLEGAYKSPFRHAVPTTAKTQESQPQESS